MFKRSMKIRVNNPREYGTTRFEIEALWPCSYGDVWDIPEWNHKFPLLDRSFVTKEQAEMFLDIHVKHLAEHGYTVEIERCVS